MDERGSAGRVPAVIERFVKQLYITAKAVRLYPAASNMPKERAAALLAVLKTAQREHPEIALYFSRDGIFFGEEMVFPDTPAYVEFAREFYNRNVDRAVFHVGTTAQELLDFLGVLLATPEGLREAGGFEARLWDVDVAGITVKEIAARILDADLGEQEEVQPDEPWPPTPEEIDEALSDHGPQRPGAHRMLMRVALDPAAVRDYLRTSSAARGITPEDALLAGRLSALARMIAVQPPDERERLQQTLAEAVLDLDEAEHRRVVANRLLPAARREPPTAQVVAHMEANRLGGLIAASFDPSAVGSSGEAARTGMIRALHNLAMLRVHDRAQVDRAFSEKATERGASEAYVSSVLAEAMPTRVLPGPARPPDPAVATAVEVVELAAKVKSLPDGTDPDLESLREEAPEGIDDGTILSTLVSVAARERRPAEFEHTVGVLESSVAMLIESQHFSDAADAAEALSAAAHDWSRPAEQREALEAVLSRISDRRSIEQVASAVKLYPPGSPEQGACRRLLSRLGSESLEKILGVIADEPDMATRKALVDALAESAAGFVPELARWVVDPRWYLVRNVVYVLGRTRDPAALPAIARAARYPEARVRRESIRALDTMPDPRVVDLLIGALADDDAANVQLAARALGSRGVRSAVRPLQEVALGEGGGNRELGPRAEAIEALGRIGDPSSVPVLESLTRPRGLMGLGRSRELIPVAKSALQAIAARGATGSAPPATGSGGGGVS